MLPGIRIPWLTPFRFEVVMSVPDGLAWQLWIDQELAVTLATDPVGDVCLVSTRDGTELGYAHFDERKFVALRQHLAAGGEIRCTVRDFQVRASAPWLVRLRFEPADGGSWVSAVWSWLRGW